MVEPAGDGIHRPIQYARFRDDVPAKPGYSRELIALTVDPKYYDKMDEQPPYIEGCYTYLDYFERHVNTRPNDSFLGYRPKQADGSFGPYDWISYKQVQTQAH